MLPTFAFILDQCGISSHCRRIWWNKVVHILPVKPYVPKGLFKFTQRMVSSLERDALSFRLSSRFKLPTCWWIRWVSKRMSSANRHISFFNYSCLTLFKHVLIALWSVGSTTTMHIYDWYFLITYIGIYVPLNCEKNAPLNYHEFALWGNLWWLSMHSCYRANHNTIETCLKRIGHGGYD